MQPKEKLKVTKTEDVHVKEVDVFWYYCDDPCKTRQEDYKGLHFCNVCLHGTVLCETCVKLVKTNKLPYRKCSSEHELFQFYPVAEKMEDLNVVKINEKIVPVKE